MRPNQSQRCDPAFSAVTPISEEVTPKASELCIIGVLLQIRTVILIQSVSGLRFLIFMLKHCVCGTFAPSGPKRKPGQVVFLVGFLPLRGFCGPRNR